MSIELCNPLDIPNWDDLLLAHPEATFFHSSAWARILHETYGYKPLYFTCMESDRIRSLLPVMEVASLLTGKRGVSLPFTDFCEPLASDKESFEDLNRAVFEYAKQAGWKSLEWRGGEKYFQGVTPSTHFFTHTISLRHSEKEMLSGFRGSNQRSIKKAIKEGVVVEMCRSLHAVEEFHRLNCMTRKHHGLPPQPFRFFLKVFEHVISQMKGVVALARHRTRVIAGSVFVHFGKKVSYKYGASERSFQHLRANNLVMWEAIRWYLSRGFESLCLGRTEPENGGLLQFKRGWNPEEGIGEYRKYDVSKGEFVRGSPRVRGFHNKVFRVTPLPVLKWIGGVLYKHVG